MSIVERLSTSYLTVRKPYFELFESAPSASTSTADVGYYGAYNDDGKGVKYTGFYRDQSDAEHPYILFDNLSAAGLPSANSDQFTTDANNMNRASLKIKDLNAAKGTFTGDVSGVKGTFSGALAVDDKTNSTSSSSGSIQTDGGLGVALDVYIGGSLNGTSGTFSGALAVDDKTNSTSSSTGSIQTDGGLGVALDVYIGGSLNGTSGTFSGALAVDDKTNSTSTATGSIQTDGGLGVVKDVYIGGSLNGTSGTFSGALAVDDKTNSTSSSTGSIQTDGGLGVAQDVHIGGSLNGTSGTFSGALAVNDTTNSTNPSTGSIQTDGGLGVALDVHIGGNLYVDGDVSIPPNPFEVIIKTASATLTDAELKANAVVFIDASEAVTITMPVLSTLKRLSDDTTQNYSYRVSIVNLTNNDVTLAAGTANTIEGQASFVLSNAYDKQTLIAGPSGKSFWLIE